jgi:hypothetical protein
MNRLTGRREFLKSGVVLAGASLLAGCTTPLPSSARPERLARVGWLTLGSRP